ncbi:MAG TPA: ABC transporter ATP-binding protein [Clostridiales bacterium]|jgi:putative ABC transport system ATP-binding protein|nr:ABC transporter ATP-binding protein [Clostridiales bacterium]
MAILECRNLSKIYAAAETKIAAVDDVSLSFEEGEFVAITGKSGSGKSTLLHLLGSLERPTSGEILYDNKNFAKLGDNKLSVLRRRRFGFVFQSYNLVDELTGYENIILPVMLDRKKPDEEYLKNLFEMLDISDRVSHLPAAMSGGQKQRVAIARAIANRPKILFADEPTGNLDSKNGAEVIRLLHELNKEFNITVILVTHDAQIANSAQRILTIEDGRVVE